MTAVAPAPRALSRRPIELGVAPEFDFAGAEYRAFHRDSGATAFQSPEWLSTFYRRLMRPPEIEPLVVVGRDASQALALVVPLIRRRIEDLIHIEYAFLGVCDYALPIVARDIDAARLSSAFLATLGAHDLLTIEPVRDEDAATWRALLGAAPEPLGFGAHALACRGAYAECRAGTFRRKAAEIDRKARRLSALGPLRLEMLSGEEAAAAMAMARHFRAGRFTGDPLQDDRFHRFYADVARSGGAAGPARTYRLRCGAATVAVLFGLIDGPAFRYLVLGCDYARFGAFSPGMIMLDRAMADWFGGGGAVFDFTIGDEPFKAAFGAHRSRMLRFRREL